MIRRVKSYFENKQQIGLWQLTTVISIKRQQGGTRDINFVSTTPFIAILILGIAVFTANPMPTQKIDITQWKSNQQILLLIENCQDGQIGMDECHSKIPAVLDQCRSFHVLACDDDRLVYLLNAGHAKIGTG